MSEHVQTLAHSDSPRSHALDLSIIIVNWNTRDLLADCLWSVYDTVRDLAFEVFVVDNASSDGSAAMVRERFPAVRLIENAENVGFARANNQAIALSAGEYVLLLNPDAVLLEGAVHVLVHVLTTSPQVGIVGAQLLNLDGSLQDSWGYFPSLAGEIPLLKRLCRRNTPSVHRDDWSVAYVDWVSGACFMLKRQVIEAVGGLDEDYFLYTEETDWCYRARRAQWYTAFAPTSHVVHLRRAASQQRMVASMLWFYQSRVRFVAKHHSALHAWALVRVLWLKALLWGKFSDRSPLRAAYPDSAPAEVTAAYGQLRDALSQPVGKLLSSTW